MIIFGHFSSFFASFKLSFSILQHLNHNAVGGVNILLNEKRLFKKKNAYENKN